MLNLLLSLRVPTLRALKILTVNASLAERSEIFQMFFEVDTLETIFQEQSCGHPGIKHLPLLVDVVVLESIHGRHICLVTMHQESCKRPDTP